MEQWEVQRTTGQCAGTERTFEPGEEYYAALVECEAGFERRDFSCAYWETHQPEVFSFWKTRVPEPNQKKKLFLDDGVLVNLFERLADETEATRVNFRFVLALILMRKRMLKYEDTKRDGKQEIWKMRRVGTKEIHDVVNPHLGEEQIQEVSQELSAILQGDFE